MNIYLDDSKCREPLFPFTYTRHVSDIRIGILTIREKWELITGETIVTNPREKNEDSIIINAHIIPTKSSAKNIIQAAKDKTPILETEDIKMLHHPWQIFQYNDWALRDDFDLLTYNRKSQPLSQTNHCTNRVTSLKIRIIKKYHSYFDKTMISELTQKKNIREENASLTTKEILTTIFSFFFKSILAMEFRYKKNAASKN